MSAQILFSRHDAVGLITLNRPDVLNAFADQMREELVDAVREAAEDTAIRAVVITGAGRGFCAGADVRRMYELVCREEWETLDDALHTERVNQLRLFKTAEARDALRAFVARKSHES